MTRICASVAAIAVLAATLPACKRPGTAAEAIAPQPSVADATGQAKCGVRKSSAKPLVVEWPSAERAALESSATRGLVAVRYEGCDMEVLTTCNARGAYQYVGLTQKREGVKITNADELYANLPVGAASLEGKLARSGQLNVDMVIVGRKEADVTAKFTDKELEGRCDTATHVVTGLTVGAFSFYTGASAEIGGGVKVGNIGAGGSTSSDREVLKQDGDGSSCVGSSTGDETPPEGCGALLRVEVVPIDRIWATSQPAAATTQAPADTTTPIDPEARRKANNWRIVTLTGYLGALASIGLLAGGLVMRRPSGVEDTEPGDERQDAIQRIRTGQGLLWAGVAGTSGFLVLALVANNRWTHYKRQMSRGKTAAVAPFMTPGGGGLTVEGRF